MREYIFSRKNLLLSDILHLATVWTISQAYYFIAVVGLGKLIEANCACNATAKLHFRFELSHLKMAHGMAHGASP